MTAMTLEEAIATGQGIERPFRCHVHEDTNASASVNVLKMVWFCHACMAKGAVDSKRAPKIEELEAMLDPERVARRYPEAWLELHTRWSTPIYWDDRFPRWLMWNLKMGQDPFTNNPTFPVHTAAGVLAGVGMRNNALAKDEKGPRYLYPPHWSASVSLFGRGSAMSGYPILCLVEGAADTAAVIETGCPALGTYGAGIHLPQIELIAQHNPKLILLGFDMDDAGEKAVSRAFGQLGRMAELVRVKWPKKDPGESPVRARKEALLRAVGKTRYGGNASTTLRSWDDRHATMVARHEHYVTQEMT